jgi:endonuclease/exonuclease/phosphatase family metal-dependent hydrolase
MKLERGRFLTALLGVVAIVLLPSLVMAQDSLRMRVMSYNIRYKNNIDSINGWEFRRDNVARLVLYHGAEIVGMQEATFDQIHDLEKRLPGYSWYGVGRTSGPGAEATPIFYRNDLFVLLDTGTFWYSETPDVKESKSWDAYFPRIASWCKFRDKRTKAEFFFFNTHFDHRGEVARQNSALVLLKRVETIAGNKPVIVTGDFNARETSVAYSNLTSTGVLKDAVLISKLGHYGPVNTSSGFFVRPAPPRARIDYIFVNAKVVVKRTATLTDQQEGRYYSDHLPIVADVAMRK